jgi:SPP1 gp7 family putative phage head morphogenesis protein
MATVKFELLPPQEAIDFFRQKKLLAPAFGWQDVYQEEHSHAFTVAKLLRLDLLQAIRDALDDAIAKGETPQEFQDRIQPLLEKEGWWGTRDVTDPRTGETGTTTFDPARLQLIYDVNTRQAYSAGRWARIERQAKINPLVIYQTMHDDRVRPAHQAWDGVVLPIDHPFWDTHYPPCGYRCRCIAYGIDQRGVDRLRQAGKAIKTEVPHIEWLDYTDRRTGQSIRVPNGIDPGFGYNPGKLRGQALDDVAQRKLAGYAIDLQQAQKSLDAD